MNVRGAVIITPGGSSAGGLCPHLGLPSAALLPLGNEPLVVHQLAALSAAGIRHVVLVCGRRTAFESCIAARRLSHPQLRIEHADIAGGEVAGLLHAAALLDHGMIFVQRGDVLLRDPIGPQLADANGNDRVEALEIDGNAGAWILPDGALRDADTPHDAPVTALLDRVPERLLRRATEGCDLRAGDRTSVLAANRLVLDRVASSSRLTRVTESEVQGRVAIGRGARVHRSVVRGPAVIGPDAYLSYAYVGPYTAIGAGAQIEGAEIEHSIVLPEARIRFLDTRLASSIIGRGASVERRITTPRSLEMTLAGGDEVRMG